ncbi:MAG: peptidase [Planctomycetaceae bacterium]|nr:peptidase [Planctomycetaceae bacterium]
MFGEFAPTPQDVYFRVLGIPCRIHPSFWIIAALFAFPRGGHLPGSIVVGLLLSRMTCLFVSILVHELGHALLIDRVGFPTSITLHACGGYAVYQPTRSVRPSVSMAISFAGPLAGFILYGIVCGIEYLLLRNDVFLRIPRASAYILLDAIGQLKYINLYWGLINLLPVFPLDGGQITRTWMGARWGIDGVRQSLVISMIVAGAAALWFYQENGHQMLDFPVLLFGMLCYQSFQAYQEVRRY